MRRVTLPGGERLRVRRIRPSDKAMLRKLHQSLSIDSQYTRFLGPVPELSARMEQYLTECDHHLHEGLFAFDDRTGTPVGTARFIRSAPGSHVAEMAITVTDDWQGRGVGTVLLDLLAERAHEEGVDRFVGEVLTSNTAVHRLLARYGPAEVRGRGAGVETLEISLGERRP